jgi:hypothetical protein
MKVSIEELEAIVRTRVCSICNTRTVDGACGAEESERCALFELFPLVAQAIMAAESDEIQPYIDAIHEHVCSACIDQRLDGSCPQRGNGCALDSHLPQVISAIEEALGRSLRPAAAK